MVSAGASIELDAPVERVWQVVADLDGYTDWHPYFRRVRGALRANDTLDVDLRLPGSVPSTRPLTALVLDMQRHRRLRWLLLSPPCSTEHQSTGAQSSGRLEAGANDEVGVYDVELVPLGSSRVRLVQHLSLTHDLHGWPADRSALRWLVEGLNDAIRERVAWSSANGLPDHQIDGTIRVSSHSGLARRLGQGRPGLLASSTDLLGRWLRHAA